MSSELAARASTTSAISRRRATGALLALSFAAFCFVTTEILPIGLLTVMAPDLHRSQSQIGLLVSGYALVVVLASIPLTRLTHHIPRRQLVTATLGVFAIASLASALAPNYGALLAARLVTALAQAMFWSVVASTATGLFSADVRGRIVARFTIGPALAAVLGVPIGTWLGQQAGWRAAFVGMSGVVLVTGALVAALVPTVPPADGGAACGTAPDPRSYGLLVLATALGVTGVMGTLTYITPFLIDISGFAPGVLSALLLVNGAAGVVGSMLIGRFLDRYPWGAFGALLLLLSGALAGLHAFGSAKASTVGLLALIGLAYSAMAASVQNLALRVAPGSTDMAAAGLSTSFNVGISGGSLFGAALLAGSGVRIVPLVSAVLTAVALATVVIGPRLGRRAVVVPAVLPRDPCSDCA